MEEKMASGNGSELPIPDWAQGESDLRGEYDRMVAGSEGVQPFKLDVVTNYSTFFAEWKDHDDTVTIHLFPRNGAEDQWEAGHYVLRCRKCRAEVPEDIAKARKPCPRCGHVGLVYVPGRLEARSEIVFPKDVLTLVKTAVDSVWDGNVAIDNVPELGAVAVQFQGISFSDAEVAARMMEEFFDAFDGQLES